MLPTKPAMKKKQTPRLFPRIPRKKAFGGPKRRPITKLLKKPKMAEPRARVGRGRKGELNFPGDIESFLYAFGDDPAPLDETVRVLDSIAKDFIVETCHQAHRAATISGRQKTKTDDFKFAVRGSEEMLGRVQGLLNAERELTDARKQFDTSEGKVGLERAGKKKEKKGKEGKEKDKDKEEEGE